jgi:hypothetical protein
MKKRVILCPKLAVGPAVATRLGQVTDMPEPNWFWMCGCDDCVARREAFGPFRSRYEAERDMSQTIRMCQAEINDAGVLEMPIDDGAT